MRCFQAFLPFTFVKMQKCTVKLLPVKTAFIELKLFSAVNSKTVFAKDF